MYGEDLMNNKHYIHELEDKNKKQEKMIEAIKKQYDCIIEMKDKEIQDLKDKLKSISDPT